MAGSITGGKLAAKTNKELYGKDFYAAIGAKGGKAKGKPKGFAANKDLARRAGQKGGTISRRGKGKKTVADIPQPDYSTSLETTIYFTKSARVRAFLRTVGRRSETESDV
jgi:uncharacterized protein